MPAADTEAGPLAVRSDFPLGVRALEVVRREQVTPRMRRLVLGGVEADNFESHTPDEHVKLVFPDEDTGQVRHPVADGDHLDWPRPFPTTRDYTIRRYDRDRGEVWVDFVVHRGGLASDWAQQVEPGTTVWVAGPRGSMVVPDAFTHRVVLADHTALPAVARMLEELPADVTADVAVVVPDAGEEQPLAVREGIAVRWLHLDAPQDEHGFDGFLAALVLPADRPTFVWAAGEAQMLKPVRRWAKDHGFGKGTVDVSGYWKAGQTQDEREEPSVLDRVKHRLAHLLHIEHHH